jgi:hypothetical protein
MKKVITVALMLLTAVDVSSCSTENSNDNDSMTYFDTTLGVKPNLGWNSPMIAGGDTLSITNVRLIQGNSKFILSSRTFLLPAKNTVILFGDSLKNPLYPYHGLYYMSYLSEHGSAYPTAKLAGNYKAFHLKIVQAPTSLEKYLEQGETWLNTFFKNGHYSLIVTGKYNDSPFTFKTKKDFDIPLKFHPSMHVSRHAAGVGIGITVNVKKWFKDKHGFLDPSDASNMSAINTNIENSFSMENGNKS